MKRIIFALTVAALVVIGVTDTHTARADSHATLTGVVLLNNQVAPPGVDLIATNAANAAVCGSGVTGAGGVYQIALTNACGSDSSVSVALSAFPDEPPPPAFKLDGQSGVIGLVLEFPNFSDAALASLTAAAALRETTMVAEAATVEEAVETAIDAAVVVAAAAAEAVEAADADKPLLDEGAQTFVVLLAVVLTATALFAFMVLLGYRLAVKSLTRKPGVCVPELSFRRQVEALVLVSVIAAVIILGVANKIESDGMISILAAIVGFGIARAAAGEGPGSAPVVDPQSAADIAAAIAANAAATDDATANAAANAAAAAAAANDVS